MKTKDSSSRPARHVPQRTCVACRQVKDKHELVRLVRVSGGSVEVDPGGRKAGRGAYLCRVQQCWEAGLREGRLEYTLRAKLTQPDQERLIEAGKALLAE